MFAAVLVVLRRLCAGTQNRPGHSYECSLLYWSSSEGRARAGPHKYQLWRMDKPLSNGEFTEPWGTDHTFATSDTKLIEPLSIGLSQTVLPGTPEPECDLPGGYYVPIRKRCKQMWVNYLLEFRYEDIVWDSRHNQDLLAIPHC